MPPSSRGADLDERPNLRGSGSHDSPSKLSNKTSKLVSSAIVEKLKPMAARVKTLTFDNGKEFARHAHIDERLKALPNLTDRLPAGNAAAIKLKRLDELIR